MRFTLAVKTLDLDQHKLMNLCVRRTRSSNPYVQFKFSHGHTVLF